MLDISNNEYDKPLKNIEDEKFEGMRESKEIIEDRINRINLKIVDITMKQ
jgi:hypothetical protein